MSNTITAQLIRHDLSGFTTMASHQSLEEPHCCCSISLCLEKHIYYFAILINSSPEIMLLTIDLYEHFIDKECVAVSSVLSLQTPCIFGTEFNTPQSDGFIADSDTSFGKEIFNVTLAEVETIIEPNCVGGISGGNLWRL
jgi:hypothetical protein